MSTCRQVSPLRDVTSRTLTVTYGRSNRKTASSVMLGLGTKDLLFESRATVKELLLPALIIITAHNST